MGGGGEFNRGCKESEKERMEAGRGMRGAGESWGGGERVALVGVWLTLCLPPLVSSILVFFYAFLHSFVFFLPCQPTPVLFTQALLNALVWKILFFIFQKHPHLCGGVPPEDACHEEGAGPGRAAGSHCLKSKT